MTFVWLREWYNGVMTHDCECPRVVSCDSQVRLMVISECLGCGETFQIRLSDAKKGPPSDPIWNLVRHQDYRKEMRTGSVWITEERD